jgi:hypothetical protein
MDGSKDPSEKQTSSTDNNDIPENHALNGKE